MSYESRFTQVNYDKECGLKQKALREHFLALEKFVLGTFPPKRVPDVGMQEFAAIDAHSRKEYGDARGQEKGRAALWTAYDDYVQGETLDGVLNNLEISYMWLGKAIRDLQLEKSPTSEVIA